MRKGQKALHRLFAYLNFVVRIQWPSCDLIATCLKKSTQLLAGRPPGDHYNTLSRISLKVYKIAEEEKRVYALSCFLKKKPIALASNR